MLIKACFQQINLSFNKNGSFIVNFTAGKKNLHKKLVGAISALKNNFDRFVHFDEKLEHKNPQIVEQNIALGVIQTVVAITQTSPVQ